ncbi:hypothetical protein SeLEV6574_g03359 [Synchytrium endobioticum]|uniref:Uncharacterized protein n=1 Tax=Synchytrium endobioticum TaxID=286115 RepID=A0A507D4M3_9FUNG|nr:hypothetical protein SeLEV6574_g03359 [Synchytrium endobioticum]
MPVASYPIDSHLDSMSLIQKLRNSSKSNSIGPGNHRIDADCHHYRHPNGLRLVCVPLYASPTDKVAPQPHAEEPSFAAFTSTQKTRSRHSSASGALSRYVCKLVPPYSAASRYD